MRLRVLVLAALAVASVAGVAVAVSPRDSAGDFFIAAMLNTPHDNVAIYGEARGRAGHAFMIPNNGAASAFVVGCEQDCDSVTVSLSAAGLPPIAVRNAPSNVHVAVLNIPANYARSLSNFEVRIALGCSRPEGCYYRWGLLNNGSVPTLAQRGMRAAPSDAEWGAASPPAAALRWTARPSGDDLRYFYPIQAWNNNRAGSAQLQCIVGADGAMRCRARSETPSGAGFGDAARRLSTLLRVETRDAAGQATANRQVVIPVQFARPH